METPRPKRKQFGRTTLFAARGDAVERGVAFTGYIQTDKSRKVSIELYEEVSANGTKYFKGPVFLYETSPEDNQDG